MTDDNTSEAISDLPRPFWHRMLGKMLAWGLILLAAAAASWYVWDVVASRALHSEMARIVAVGEPITFAQLAGPATGPTSPDGASPAYAAALGLLCEADQVGELYGSLDDEDASCLGPIAMHEAVLADLLVSDNRFSLEMLDRAAELPTCQFDLGIDASFDFLPRLSRARGLVKVASLRTRLLAMRGRGDAAVDSVLATLAMSRIFHSQPTIITGLLETACLATCTRDVPAILEFARPSDEALIRLEQGLLQAERSFDVKRIWQGERIFTMATMLPLIPGEWKIDPIKSQPPMLPPGVINAMQWRPLMRTWLTQEMRYFGRHIAAAEEGWPAILDAMQEAMAQRRSWPQNVLLSISAPSQNQAVIQFARGLAGLQSARVAILVELHRRRTGRLPNNLDDLGGESRSSLPTDPFTGLPLLYRQTGGGFVVYSVDQDLQDDGGRRYDGKTGDWPVSVRQPG